MSTTQSMFSNERMIKQKSQKIKNNLTRSASVFYVRLVEALILIIYLTTKKEKFYKFYKKYCKLISLLLW